VSSFGPILDGRCKLIEEAVGQGSKNQIQQRTLQNRMESSDPHTIRQEITSQEKMILTASFGVHYL